MPSRSIASSCASPGCSARRHSMPVAISSKRPAALRRGPKPKPRSLAFKRAGLRLAIRSSAAIPGLALPARIRFNPSLTSIRLFLSSGTTSATVPSATKSSKSAIFGSGKLFWPNQSCSLNLVRSASIV